MSRYFIAFLAASFVLLCFVAVLDRMAAGQLRQFRQEARLLELGLAELPVREDQLTARQRRSPLSAPYPSARAPDAGASKTSGENG
jgi:hypothetical protein